MSAVEMFAIFREIKTPGFTYDSFVVSPITSDTPDSPDEVPGTRHWIEAIVQLECDRRNAEARREERVSEALAAEARQREHATECELFIRQAYEVRSHLIAQAKNGLSETGTKRQTTGLALVRSIRRIPPSEWQD